MWNSIFTCAFCSQCALRGHKIVNRTIYQTITHPTLLNGENELKEMPKKEVKELLLHDAMGRVTQMECCVVWALGPKTVDVKKKKKRKKKCLKRGSKQKSNL